MEGLRAHDIPHSPIMSMADIFTDPHYRAREMIVDVSPDIGPLPQPGVVPTLSLTPGRITPAGAVLGRHTDEALSGLLGMSGDEIAALRAEGVKDVTFAALGPAAGLAPFSGATGVLFVSGSSPGIERSGEVPFESRITGKVWRRKH